MTIVTATELQNNFGKYLQSVIDGDEIVILKSGKEVARLVSKQSTVSFLTDSLIGVIEDVSLKESRKERLSKYESLD